MRIYYVLGHERHAVPNHPEGPHRIEWILEYVGARAWRRTDRELPYRIHERAYVDLIRSVKQTTWLDPDTYVTPSTFDVAARALTASYLAPENSVVLTRPPGHHAGPNYGMGFCIFNNAVAALYGQENAGVLDVDAHHGNGTEDFARILGFPYTSVHMVGYPGTGQENAENVMNVAVGHPLTDDEFLNIVRKLLHFLEGRRVEFLVVSLGLDGLAEDPLTYFALTPAAFKRLGELLSDWNLKVVLEGGYSRRIGEALYAFLEGITK